MGNRGVKRIIIIDLLRLYIISKSIMYNKIRGQIVIKMRIISYEIVWAVERNAPNMLNFLLEVQPLTIKKYTEILIIVNKVNVTTLLLICEKINGVITQITV